MSPPRIPAAPALAAARSTPDPVDHFGGAPHVRFALLSSASPYFKPVVFDTLAALAGRIHRERGEQGLEIVFRRTVLWAGRGEPGRRVVPVWTQGPDGQRDRWIGYAWLEGAGPVALRNALHAHTPDTTNHAEAA